MTWRTITEAAAHFTQTEGREVSRRQVQRWLEQGYFRQTKKLEWGDGRQGVWFIGDERAPDPSEEPIPRRQPKGPRLRSQRPNAVIE
jgi:hypothetical protein